MLHPKAVYLSDGVIALSSRPGRLVGDVELNIPRPRERRSHDLSRLEAKVLTLLLEGETPKAEVFTEA